MELTDDRSALVVQTSKAFSPTMIEFEEKMMSVYQAVGLPVEDVLAPVSERRKVFKNFAYDKKKVSLGYVLSELKLYGKKYFYEFYNSVREMAIPSHTKLSYITN